MERPAREVERLAQGASGDMQWADGGLCNRTPSGYASLLELRKRRRGDLDGPVDTQTGLRGDLAGFVGSVNPVHAYRMVRYGPDFKHI
jgi:hypothetical protein